MKCSARTAGFAGICLFARALVGARDFPTAHRRLKSAVTWGAGLALVTSLAIALSGRWLMGLFSRDAGIVAFGQPTSLGRRAGSTCQGSQYRHHLLAARRWRLTVSRRRRFDTHVDRGSWVCPCTGVWRRLGCDGHLVRHGCRRMDASGGQRVTLAERSMEEQRRDVTREGIRPSNRGITAVTFCYQRSVFFFSPAFAGG
jgi:hypothetical protein